jgi:hexosaminidase
MPFEGQFNPILNLTYDVLTDVTKYVNSIFTDKYVHLGGDEVDFDVWDKVPAIK